MRGLFVPKNTGLGGVLQVHTVLRARKFRADWPAIVKNFPELRNYPNPSVQWDELVKLMGPQGTSDPDMWRFVGHLRKPSMFGTRIVRDRVITTAYVTFLALMHGTDATTIGDFKYHDSGIGTGDEAVGDTGLGTPWGGARSVGDQTPAAGVYTSVATTTYNASKAITEHGLFNAAADGTLMDRTKFAAINVVDTNQIEWTFTITFTAGG